MFLHFQSSFLNTDNACIVLLSSSLSTVSKSYSFGSIDNGWNSTGVEVGLLYGKKILKMVMIN